MTARRRTGSDAAGDRRAEQFDIERLTDCYEKVYAELMAYR